MLKYCNILLLLLCAANRVSESTVSVVHWVDVARAEVQVATVVPIVRTGNPIEAVRRHEVQRTGIAVAIAACRKEKRNSLFIWFIVKI